MRMKHLGRYKTGGTNSNMKLEIPIPKTPEGRAYRFSPNPEAHPRHFLLGNFAGDFELPKEMTPRMTHMPRTNGTICPYSGILEDDSEFTHPDDVDAVKAIAIDAVKRDVMDSIHGMFDDLSNQFRSSSAISIKRGARQHIPRPHFARKDLLRLLVCDECGRDYGVFAISLFCPDCGAPNIHLHFAREVALVRKQVELAESLGDDQGELAYRLLGNAHEDVLTAFEATLKTVYLYKVAQRDTNAPAIKSIGNAFQNIEKSNARFAEFDFSPFSTLDETALAALSLNIQKRHIIGHNLGIADEKFVDRASDARIGETIPIVGNDIIQFAEICQMVVDRLDAWIARNDVMPPDAKSETSMPINIPQPADPSQVVVGGLTPLAVRIGLWLSEKSELGFDDHVGGEDVVENFPGEAEDDLAMAVAELSADDYISTSHTMSSRIPRIRTTIDLYATFDPISIGSDPAKDALTLLDDILSKDGTLDVEELHKRTEWPLRRFNPALNYVVAHVGEGRVMRGGNLNYAVRAFALIDEDRVTLERLATRLGAH